MINNTSQKIDLDRLKEAIPITELAKTLGLELRGRQARCYNGQAHSNNDRNFSLGLDLRKNRYKCFACGESGSVIDLYKAVKGIELKEAINELAEMAGLAKTSHHKPQGMPRNDHTYKSEPEVRLVENSSNLTVYEALKDFCNELDDESIRYLTGETRGLNEDTLKRFGLFSVRDYQKTNDFLKSNFSLDVLRDAGIISDACNLIFYHHKIIVPFVSVEKIVYLWGRRLNNEHPKNLNLKGIPTPLFNTDTLVELEKCDKIYICEGVFDAMMLEQGGYNAVAILGVTNFKPETTELFKGLDVVLCLDNDEAGKRARDEIAKTFLLKGQAVKSKQLPDGVGDVTDYFIKL